MPKKTENDIVVKKEKKEILPEEEKKKHKALKMRRRNIRNQKRYTQVFQLSRSRLEHATEKPMTIGAVEVFENKLATMMPIIDQKCKRFNRLILKRKGLDKRAYDSQIEIFKNKNSL